MKYSLEIVDDLYQLINVPAVKSLITGKIYQGDPTDKSQKDDISIRCLVNKPTYLQTGYINLNIYTRELESGRPNLAKFSEIVKAIVTIVEDARHGNSSFQIEDDKGFFKDKEKDGMYFYNLKLKFQTY